MAVLHHAEITPTKLEMLQAWVPQQLWIGDADASDLEVVGAYRFDDPAGAVGIETHLLRMTDGTVVQVPVTYRDAPLDGGDDALITTMQHSVLGPRWVYDGAADPVCVAAFVTAMVTGSAGVDQHFEGEQEVRTTSAQVRGSGLPGADVADIGLVTVRSEGTETFVDTGTTSMVLLRTVGEIDSVAAPATLTGTWPGHEAPAVLAHLQ